MSDADGGGPGQREVAYRLFAAEYDDADLSYSEGQEDRAPNYVVTPTGARVNRAFVVGVLTEVEQVSEDVLRARVVDPTGAFVLYAGQYQPDEQAFLDRAEPPTFVSVTGKARTFQPDDADRVYTSLRPESINEVDAETRDRWTVGTAERTLRRVGEIAGALLREERGEDLETALADAGLDEGLASGIALAIEHYGTSPAYLEAVRDVALDAARLVAGEVEEVDTLSVAPDAPGEADLAAIAELAETPIPDAEQPGDERDRATAGTAETTGDAPPETVDPVGGSDDTTSAGTGETSTEASAAATESTSPESTSAEPSSDTAVESADVGDFEPGEFELDEEEREEIEAEYGTEFQSGAEVDDPGEADIETPDPETATAEAEPSTTDEPATASVDQGGSTAVEESTTAAVDDESEDASATAEETQSVEETAEEAETATAETEESADVEPATAETAEAADAEDVDIEDATVAVMEELDDGSGADRGTVVETVAERHGVDTGAVEEAIQDALMDGRCYEPDDTTLKPI